MDHRKVLMLWDDAWPVWRALLAWTVALGAASFTALLLLSGGTPVIPHWAVPVWALVAIAVAAVLLAARGGAGVALGLLVPTAATVVLFAPFGWANGPDHLRVAALAAVGSIVVALVLVSREFSRATLRVLAVAAIAGGVALTMKVGRTAESPASEHTAAGELSDGATALVQSTPGLGDVDVVGSVPYLGWVLVAVAGAAGYRRLEILSGDGDIGPVTVPQPAESAPPEDRKRLAAFRTYVIRNIPEPGAIPGSTTLTPVTDLLEATGPRGNLAGLAVKMAQALLFPVTGYRIDALVTDGPAPDTKSPTGGPEVVSVTVLIRDARTGRTRQTFAVRDADEQVALRDAGYRAAAWVLEQSRWTPSWAMWNHETGKQLGLFVDALDGEAPAVRLKQAVRWANRSGLLLTELGQHEDASGRRVDALLDYLRAVSLHPRYPTARYRAAISFSLLADPGEAAWSAIHRGTREVVLRRLHEVARRLHLPADAGVAATTLAKDDVSDADARFALCRIADHVLQWNCAAMTRHGTLHNAFRRSERRYWLGLLVHWFAPASRERATRRTFQTVSGSARTSVLFRRGDEPAATEAHALTNRYATPGRLRLGWQVPFNLACGLAILARTTKSPGDRTKALDLLDDALGRPFCTQLTRAWARADPDLVSLHGDPRFAMFLDRLRSDRYRPPTFRPAKPMVPKQAVRRARTPASASPPATAKAMA